MWSEARPETALGERFQRRTGGARVSFHGGRSDPAQALIAARMRAQLSELRARLVRPMTRESVCYHYLPIIGVKSYLELSINVFFDRQRDEEARRPHQVDQGRDLAAAP